MTRAEPDVDVGQLRQLLDRIDTEAPPVLEVAEALADATDRSVDATQGEIYDALDAGVLVEEGDGWSGVALADPYREGDTAETPNTGERKAEEPGTPAKTPSPNATRDGPLDDNIAELSEEWFHPPAITIREWWVAWILDGEGRKRPVAPWETGHAYPVKWNDDLPEAERPETDYSTARRWVEFSLENLGLSLPEGAQSDGLDLGIILPAERGPREERVTLIDWDDVRDPETGEIHSIAAEFIKRYGGYVEISTSGEGLHQFVIGGLRHRGKFIAPIDEEPFIGDDLPQVEVYDGGRHVAMTGKHVAGTDHDLIEGQECIDEIVTQYADAEQDAGNRRFDPESGERSAAADDQADLDGQVPEPDTGDYSGPSLEALRERKPADRSLDYHAVIETFYRGGGNAGGDANIQNWRLEGLAAALGERDDLSAGEVKDDLGGAYLDDTDVNQGTKHRTPERVDYGYDRAASGRLHAPSVETLVDYGVLPPEILDDSGDEDSEEYRPDPREIDATVDLRRAWDAAGRVSPEDLDSDDLPATDGSEAFACPVCGDAVDIVRAVAVYSGLVEECQQALGDEYPSAYHRARESYGAPLPEYYTEADAIAEFDALLDVIGEVGFFHLDTDALASDVTQRGDEVGGDAVRALDPAWRESDSGASVLVFESGAVWDADTERVLDAVRFAALDSGLLELPDAPLQGSAFTEAYRRLREEYGAPVPRWDPATDGSREVTPQLPPSEDLVDEVELDGVAPDALDAAREEVEGLLADATAEADTPTVVTALPATGKTTGTVKTARDHPLSYLAPRKELQQQALQKAERWGVDARVCPVFSEERVDEGVLGAAVSHVREAGKSRLRDRWAILSAAFDDLEDDEAPDPGDIFEERDEDDIALDRPTCESAEGDHGVAWALAVHVARQLGYTPQEIHTQARGLFGAELPCTCDEECEYAEGWDHVADADDTADLVVGSYVHGHVESVRTEYTRGPDGLVEKTPRSVVLDEFPGEAFVSEFGEEALDFATWLAGCLREDVADRRDMFDVDLYGDEWVRAWLDGNGGDIDGVGDTIDVLARVGELIDARRGAREILDEVEDGLLKDLGLASPLRAVAENHPAEAYRDLAAALEGVPSEHPAVGLTRWIDDDVREPLGAATLEGAAAPDPAAIEANVPVGGDLADLIDRAADAAREPEAARDVLAAATTALRGGPEGCRRLAAWAEDGYAHPDAHHLLTGVITPTSPDSDVPGARRVETDTWAFDPDATNGTVVDRVPTTERTTAVVDRNGHGALIHTPPSRIAGNGDKAPLVGLDATGRRDLWATSLGEDVTLADIHDTPAERAEFLTDALGLQVIQAADRPRPYEGDPMTKDTDGDVALLEAIADEYAGLEAPRQRGEEVVPVGKPAVVTTKQVREVLEADPRLDNIVAAWDNYGNVTGANDLGDHRLAALLGSQHYGDNAIERFCALAGREVDSSRESGRGDDLDYGDDLANTFLTHMREDQTMQAILRFARGDSGATVVARTSALREDLPVVADGQVVETWSDTAAQIAGAYRRLGGEFTVADVRDAVDVTSRQVRRVLGELAEAGYVKRVDSGPGIATTYDQVDHPGAGEVNLPERDKAIDTTPEPGGTTDNQYYTWNVRVRTAETHTDRTVLTALRRDHHAPPAPDTADGVEPPG